MTMRKTDSIRCPDRNAFVGGEVESGSVSAEGTMMNWAKGVIHSQYAGLTRSGARIKVGSRLDLRVRWVKREERSFVVGQPVVATIPAEAVRLEHGMFRRSKQRWIAGLDASSSSKKWKPAPYIR